MSVSFRPTWKYEQTKKSVRKNAKVVSKEVWSLLSGSFIRKYESKQVFTKLKKSGLKRWMVSSDAWFVNMEIRTKENNVSKLQQWPQKPCSVLGDPFK